ncbi:MAG: hypothetical protein M3O36_07450 [Myxococcota bacterium]|nr:hypothetical protein [Myxococcota bacterium]
MLTCAFVGLRDGPDRYAAIVPAMPEVAVFSATPEAFGEARNAVALLTGENPQVVRYTVDLG